jgi:hypothetical protein
VAQRERKIGKGQYEKDGWGVTYTARVRVIVNGVVREGWGAGHGIDVDLGMAHESAIKEAETDAMKRALMTFGNPFGLALYDKDQANVGAPMDPRIASLPLPLRADLEGSEIECVLRALDAIAKAPSKDALNAWWPTFKADAREILSTEYLKTQLMPFISERAATLPQSTEEAT